MDFVELVIPTYIIRSLILTTGHSENRHGPPLKGCAVEIEPCIPLVIVRPERFFHGVAIASILEDRFFERIQFLSRRTG